MEDDPDRDEDAPLARVEGEASYACWACGEEIVIPIDATMGQRQDFVEDCPVCCRPNEIHVELDPSSDAIRCWNDSVG